MTLGSPAARARTEPLADWAAQRIVLEGRRFSFEGHEYLRAIYNDTASHIVLCKAAQIGGTTWAILRSLHACLEGLNVMYFFPTRTDVLEFSKSRVGPLLTDNPFLTKLMTDTDTAGLKRIGTAHLYLRGMQSAVGMKSVPADMIVFDELDEATPDAKTMAKERLAHSDYKRIIELSNPSLPDYGIDEAFQASDKRHWTVRCSSCNRWTGLDLEFPTSLGKEVPVIGERQDGSAFRACPKCRKELDMDVGEWVAEHPDRSTHGYCISQLVSSLVDPAEILHEYQTTRFPERFYNLKLGIAWADNQNRLDRMSVLRCCGHEPMLTSSDRPCTMGVDTGRELHVVISRRDFEDRSLREVVYVGVHHNYHELDRLMERFKVRNCVIDALPEIHATRDFQRRYKGRVWLNYFQESQRGRYRWDSSQRIVYENRTEALDASRQVFRDKRVLLPRQNRMVEMLAEHMAADAKRLVEDDETGAKAYRYVRTGTNHFSLAFTYDCIAWSRSTGGSARLTRRVLDDSFFAF